MVTSPLHTSRELEEHLERLQLDGPVADDELERFRNEWRAEVKSKKPFKAAGGEGQSQRAQAQGVVSDKPTRSIEPPAATGKGKEVEHGPVRWKSVQSPETSNRPLARDTAVTSPGVSTRTLSPVTSPRAGRTILPGTREIENPSRAAGAGSSRSPERPRTVRPPGGRPAGRAKGDALSIYARAVEAEQGGQLNDALNLYRQAFKMDDNIDRLYAHHRSKIKIEPDTPSSTDVVSAHPPANAPYSFQRTIQTTPDYDPLANGSAPATSKRLSPLTALFRRADPEPTARLFEPQNEDLPIPLARLPGEVLEHVFHHLDVAALESFGSTCWRARWLTAHSEEWKRRAEKIYSRIPVNPDGAMMRDIGVQYGGEWRTALVERERVRMDGCYIAVCHYIRPGAGDEWVTITHMITYHRFLRFYPDGTVISFLTTDHPSDVVPILRPTLRAKGLHIGTYTLAPIAPTEPPGSTQHPDTKRATPNRRILITDLLEPGNPSPKYEFEMSLSLRETGRGRWNKLDMLDYSSVNLASGEVLGLALKHQKPFYFSKVRSYQPAL